MYIKANLIHLLFYFCSVDLIVSTVFKLNKLNLIQNVTMNHPTLLLSKKTNTTPSTLFLDYLYHMGYKTDHHSMVVFPFVGFPQPFGLHHIVITYLHAALKLSLDGFLCLLFYFSFKSSWVRKNTITSFLFCFSYFILFLLFSVIRTIISLRKC